MEENCCQSGLDAYAQGQYLEALQLFEEGIRHAPRWAKLWNHRGNVLAQLKRYPEALASYEKAIACYGDYHQAWYNRGVVFVELGAYGNGIECFNQAIRLHGDPLYIHRRESIWVKNQLVPIF